MPEYVTAFEISGQSSGWPFAFVGLIPLLVGAVIILGKLLFKLRRPNWFMACSWCGFGLLWISVVGAGILKEESDAFTAYRTGEYSTVEGVVTDFHPMPYEGHDSECFSVQSQRFCYSDYAVTPGFHNAASHGGPIRPGLAVRIAYYGSNILKLEIAKGQLQTPAESRVAAESARAESQRKAGNDPVQQGLGTAFFFTAVGMTLFWNLQWKRTMGFWLRPPYRRTTEYAFGRFSH